MAFRVIRIAVVILVVAAALVGSFYAAIYFWNRHVARLGSATEAAVKLPSSDAPSDEILRYLKQGRYDDAIHSGLKALRNDPTDAPVYQQLATISLIRAQKEQSEREQRLSEAVTYLDKALSVDSNDPVNLLQSAHSFLHAGDISVTEGCEYYIRAHESAKQAASAYSGSQITIAGQVYPVDSTRREFTASGRTFRIDTLERQRDLLLADTKTKLAASECH